MTEECQYKKRIIKERRLFFLFAGLSIAAPLLSLIPDIRPADQTLGAWLQRSGSAMVVLALLAEMRAYQMFDVFKPSGYVGPSYRDAHNKYLPQVKICNFFAFILIAAGTLLWGYGDLLIQRL